jgi:hypothetical protein
LDGGQCARVVPLAAIYGDIPDRTVKTSSLWMNSILGGGNGGGLLIYRSNHQHRCDVFEADDDLLGCGLWGP